MKASLFSSSRYSPAASSAPWLTALDEAAVFRIADQFYVVQPLEQSAGAVARRVVDDDQFEGNIGIFPQRAQALQAEMSLVVEHEQYRQQRRRGLVARPGHAKRESLIAGEELIQLATGMPVENNFYGFRFAVWRCHFHRRGLSCRHRRGGGGRV